MRSTTAGAAADAETLTLALPRGRILDEALPLFARAGIDLGAAEKARAGRRLVIAIPEHALRVLIVRDTDVPAYVEHGAADIGHRRQRRARRAGPRSVRAARSRHRPLPDDRRRARGRPVDERAQIHLRFATKFPEITRRHLQSRGIAAEVIKLYGAIELGPLIGLADRIVDLMSTGETLRQNHLVEVETIMEVSARLCVGRAAAKLHSDRIDDLVARLRKVV